MALYTYVYDSTLQKRRAVAYPGYLDTVAAGAASTDITIVGVTIDSTHAIDAYVAGRLQTEGTHYTRNTSLNKLVFSVIIPPGEEVKIRVWLK